MFFSFIMANLWSDIRESIYSTTNKCNLLDRVRRLINPLAYNILTISITHQVKHKRVFPECPEFRMAIPNRAH